MTPLDRLAALLRDRSGRQLVAVDGPDAAGKTTFADRLADLLPGRAVRASVDDVTRPRAERYRQGALSPQGCYEDTTDLAALRGRLLAPPAAGADEVVVRAFDTRADRPVDVRAAVPDGAVLVVDGVFLLRPELREHWTTTVHLTVPEEVVLARAVVRDADSLGGPDAVVARYRARYLPAQALYRRDARPEQVADVVLDNADPSAPVVLAWRT